MFFSVNHNFQVIVKSNIRSRQHFEEDPLSINGPGKHLGFPDLLISFYATRHFYRKFKHLCWFKYLSKRWRFIWGRELCRPAARATTGDGEAPVVQHPSLRQSHAPRLHPIPTSHILPTPLYNTEIPATNKQPNHSI